VPGFKKRRDRPHGGQPAQCQLETTALIVIAILILAITILRYWHNLNWSGH